MSCRNSLLLFPAQCAGKFGALWAGEHWELPSRVSRTVFALFSRPVFFCVPGRKKEVEWMNKKQKLNQNRAPIYEALERFRKMRVVPFDVPGHKRGRGNPELTAFLGQQCVGVDVNSMKPLDNLCHPVSVIREAEELAADAFGAAHAFLMVGGTTSSVQSMVLTACKRGDEIILPRNVHRSVLNALVLCGAVPVYVNPEVDKRLGISLGMKREQVEKAIREHPNAVAVLVNNPI